MIPAYKKTDGVVIIIRYIFIREEAQGLSLHEQMNKNLTALMLCTILALVYSTGTAFATADDAIIGEPAIEVEVEADNNGSIVITPQTPRVGERVYLSFRPANGYTVDSAIIVSDDGSEIGLHCDDKGIYFDAPGCNVVVRVGFRQQMQTSSQSQLLATQPSSSFPFSDVSPNSWYYEDVKFLYARGISNGTDANTYNPYRIVTRAELVTMLWRMVGEPESQTQEGAAFSDIQVGSYYIKAVNWASGEGVVNGIGSKQFAPETPVTREQLVTILCRYAQSKRHTINIVSDVLGVFNDAQFVSDYAKDAMAWACSESIINGSDGELRPYSNTTRAEMAAVLHRFANFDTDS